MTNVEALRRLPARLRICGYIDAVGLRGVLSLECREVEADLEYLPPVTATVVELFFLRRAVQAERVYDALTEEVTDALIELHVLVARDGHLSTMNLVALPVFGDIAFLPSPGRASSAFFGSDTAVLLTRMASVRGDVLILDAGAGPLALRASHTAKRVVAVDHAATAVACAELNLAMHGVSNVDLRVGRMDQAEFAQRFQAVIVSAPTIPAPAMSGPMGDVDGPRMLARVMQRLPGLLAEDGTARLVGVWHGDAEGVKPAMDIPSFALEHGLRVMTTVSARQPISPGSRLFEAVCDRLVRAQASDPQVVRRAHERYLSDLGASHIYFVSIVVCPSTKPSADTTGHWRRPGGGWQR